MGKPAARLTDMHVCPMVIPGTPPIPHVGGPISGPGAPTVLIGGMPAAVVGDICVCTGPPDTIAMGSTGVMIGGKPAARMGDTTAHGGTIVAGCPTVLIGEVGGTTITPSIGAAMAGGAASFPPSGAGAGAQAGAGAGRPPESAAITGAGAGAAAGTSQEQSEKKSWFKAKVVDSNGDPVSGVRYKVTLPDGTEKTGTTDGNGMVKVGYTDPGNCKFSLVELDESAWERKES